LRRVIVLIVSTALSATLFACDSAHVNSDFAPINYDLYQGTLIARTTFDYRPSSENDHEAAVSRFATDHGYEFRIERVRLSEPSYKTTLWRPDSMIVGEPATGLDVYTLGVYSAFHEPLSEEVAMAIILNLQSELDHR